MLTERARIVIHFFETHAKATTIKRRSKRKKYVSEEAKFNQNQKNMNNLVGNESENVTFG